MSELPGKGQPVKSGFPNFRQNNERSDAVAKARSLSGRKTDQHRQPGQPFFKDDREALNSEKHLACIRRLPCIVSLYELPGELGNDPHHLKCTGERGVGKKSNDCWTVPLQRKWHNDVESFPPDRELAWFRAHGIVDPIAIAWKLWEHTGDMPRMRGIILVTFMYSRAPNSWTDHASAELAKIGEPWVRPLVEAYDRARSAGQLFEK